MDHDRLRRIRNFQSDDWYPALFVRPLTIAVMLVVADWKVLTPNRLTTIANLLKLAAAALIVPEWAGTLGLGPWSSTVAAVVLLQLGVLFDHLDGTMARYRRNFTTFGSFYDKTSDVITWFAICLAIGWRAQVETGDALLLVAAVTSAAFLAVRGYMKWLLVAESAKLRWREAKADPAAAVVKHTAPPRISEPPARTRADWIRWFAKMSIQFYRFEEMDLFFWVGLGLLVDRVEWLCWLLFLSQAAGFVAMTVQRHVEAHRVDVALRQLP